MSEHEASVSMETIKEKPYVSPSVEKSMAGETVTYDLTIVDSQPEG